MGHNPVIMLVTAYKGYDLGPPVLYAEPAPSVDFESPELEAGPSSAVHRVFCELNCFDRTHGPSSSDSSHSTVSASEQSSSVKCTRKLGLFGSSVSVR
jgi:hypothetical protein